MNIENAKRAIAVLQRVCKLPEGLFDMGNWVEDICWTATKGLVYPKTEQEAVSCGTPACFAGWLALAPDIPELYVTAGGTVIDQYGNDGFHAIASFLDLDALDAARLCGVTAYLPGPKRVFSGSARPEEVIEAIEYLISRGSQQ